MLVVEQRRGGLEAPKGELRRLTRAAVGTDEDWPDQYVEATKGRADRGGIVSTLGGQRPLRGTVVGVERLILGRDLDVRVLEEEDVAAAPCRSWRRGSKRWDAAWYPRAAAFASRLPPATG